jgi:transcriptional regulator with XRE-family HTH domain
MNKCKLARTLCEETQEQFGKRIGLSPAWISMLETGKAEISRPLEVLFDCIIEKEYDRKKIDTEE